LNSKRPDGDLVKETSPLYKFFGICTTIQGHNLFVTPINKTVGAPCLSPSLLPSNLHQSKLSFFTSAPPKNQWRAVETGAVPATKQNKAALAPVEGGDRQLLFAIFPRFFLSISDNPLLFKAHPLESGPCAGQSSSAGRLLGVV
jgi:hypothetical protein